jgi:hypothetical protein
VTKPRTRLHGFTSFARERGCSRVQRLVKIANEMEQELRANGRSSKLVSGFFASARN